MPRICIGTPHIYGRYEEITTISERYGFVEKYKKLTEDLYDEVIVYGVPEEMIYGIYFGREDPVPLVDTESNAQYLIMQKVSEYIHTKRNSDGTVKKFVWMPYTEGMRHLLRAIGKTVNVGMYASGEKMHDIVDIVIIQTGYFFQEMHTQNTDAEEQSAIQHDFLKTMQENRVVYYTGDFGSDELPTGTAEYTVQEGEKLTNTVIGFQVELDGGFYTGRVRDLTSTNRSQESLPDNKAVRFAFLLKEFYSLVYTSEANVTYGIYLGGPNEQGFTTEVVDGAKSNDNQHSNVNHKTILRESGDKEQYQAFWGKIPQGAYNNDTEKYNGALIFEVIKGIVKNEWSNEAQSYFSGLLEFDNNNQLVRK